MASTTTDRRLGLSGNVAIKAPVACATTGNITLSGEQSIDGVTTSSSRVLVKDQTTASENGIYDTSSGAWTRALDCNGNYDLVTRTIVLVAGGSTQSGQVYECTTSGTITIGTSDITWGLSITYSSSTTSFVGADSNAVTRTAQGKMRDTVSVFDFMTAAEITAVQSNTWTTVTDVTDAIDNALASMTSGGALYFPTGTYRYFRGNGGAIADNIVADNLLVYGDGASTLISGYNAAGAITNDVGSQYYNIFQATGLTGITIRDMRFEGYCAPVAFWNCGDVLIDGIHDDGQLSNASNYMRDKTIYLNGCNRVRVVGCDFKNFFFGVYVAGSVGVTCTEVVVANSNFEHTTAAGSYRASYPVGVYWYYSTDGVVDGCTFRNIYSSYDNGSTGDVTQTATMTVADPAVVTVVGHTLSAGQEVYFTTSGALPTGITSGFPYYVGAISGNTFKLYPTAAAGIAGGTGDDIATSGSQSGVHTIYYGGGMGYGVYEGDGTCGNGVISNNGFLWQAKGSKVGIGVYVNESSGVAITGNTFDIRNSAQVQAAIRLDSKNQDSKFTVANNVIHWPSAYVGYAIYVYGSTAGSTYAPSVNIVGNSIAGADSAIRTYALGNGIYNITGNTCTGQGSDAMVFEGESNLPARNIVLNGNFISASGGNGIQFAYCLSPKIVNNVIVDGNIDGNATESGAAVNFTSYSYGSHIANNYIGNTVGGSGLYTYGVVNGSNAVDRIYKDVALGNTFVGLSAGAGGEFVRWFAVQPTNGIVDMSYGDTIANVGVDAGESPSWHVVRKGNTTVAVTAGSTSTTVQVANAGNMTAGDVVLLMKGASPYSTGYGSTGGMLYATDQQWHADIVASVGSSTSFVLTSGIASTDGNYSSTGAVVHWAGLAAAPNLPVSIASADFSTAGSAVNATGKFAGKLAWDSGTNKLMRAAGSSNTALWYVVDGSTSVTPTT